MLASLTAPALALALLSASPQPFSLTVSPVKQAVAVGQIRNVRVYDTGTLPLDLTASEHEIKRVNGACKMQPGLVPYVLLSRTHFHVRPRGEVTVRVRVRPGANPGKHTLATTISAPMGQRGSVRVDGAAASLMLLSVPGRVQAHAPRPCVSLATGSVSSGPPLALWVAVALVAFALVATLWRLLRNRGRHA